MQRKYHIISGLPRSGSTLLSSILNQNPKFTTGISDPLLNYIKGMINANNKGAGSFASVPEERLNDLIRGMFDVFYADGNEVCFNTNRGWASKSYLMQQLYPDSKMIICFRDIAWILDSTEKMHRKNPTLIKPLFNYQDLEDVYDRCAMLMGESDMPGFVMDPYRAFTQAMATDEPDKMLFVEYDALCKYPEKVTKKIYDFIEEPYHEHDFNNVERTFDEFDDAIKVKGMHTVKKKIEYKERKMIIPPEIVQKYDKLSYWMDPRFSPGDLNWISLRTIDKL